MESYINITEQPILPDRKTKIFKITTKDDVIELGIIKWYGPWRCYSFFPANNTLFEKVCLREILTFIENLMEQRKKKV